MTEPVRICFVCLGNICRSPTAEAVMGRLVERAGLDARIELDSAGTGGWHVGDPPDLRAAEEAERRGIAMRSRARQFAAGDFDQFDLVIAMDDENVATLERMAPSRSARKKIVKLRQFDPSTSGAPDVPDPYYGGVDGFEHVFELVERACDGLLAELVRRHRL